MISMTISIILAYIIISYILPVVFKFIGFLLGLASELIIYLFDAIIDLPSIIFNRKTAVEKDREKKGY